MGNIGCFETDYWRLITEVGIQIDGQGQLLRTDD
jgi:hypothetical protein